MTTLQSDGVWTVPLGDHHAPYAHTLLYPRFTQLPGYTVVVVDIKRLMECFTRESVGLPPAANWPADKLDIYRRYLDPTVGPRDMPLVHCNEREYVRSRWWGLRPPLREILAVVSFSNGLHRTRYLEYAGASAIPVETDSRSAPLLQRYCGADA